jgi:hypothetical protein
LIEDKKGMLLLAKTANQAVFTAITKSATAMGYIANSPSALDFFTNNTTLNNLLYDGVGSVGIVANYNITKYGRVGDNATLKALPTFNDVVNNSPVMAAITASTTGMIAISNSSIALNKFLSSSTSDLLYSAASNVGSILNKSLINNGGVGNSTLAGLATFQDVVNNATAFSALINDKTTISTILGSTAAINKITSYPNWMNSAAMLLVTLVIC